MSAALKPCPFCGGEAELCKSVENEFVACWNCGARTGVIFLSSDDAINAAKRRQLIEVWNRRTTPSHRLDAATVERCAQVADERATARRAEEAKERLPGGDIETAVVCARVASTAESIASAIRALATEPHQHGGKP